MSCAATCSIRSPWNRISPDVGRSSPEIVRSVVVLPAPLVPISDTTCPCSTLKLIFFTATILP